MRMVVSPFDPACDSTAVALVDNVTPGAMVVFTDAGESTLASDLSSSATVDWHGVRTGEPG